MKTDKKLNLIVIILISIALVSIYAPIISSDKPLFILYKNGTIEFPALFTLLDKNFFESSVDIFFNLLVIELPILALFHFVIRMKKKTLITFFIIVHIVIFSFLENSPIRYPYRDYKSIIKSDDNISFVINPINNYSYREMDTKINNPSPPDR